MRNDKPPPDIWLTGYIILCESSAKTNPHCKVSKLLMFSVVNLNPREAVIDGKSYTSDGKSLC